MNDPDDVDYTRRVALEVNAAHSLQLTVRGRCDSGLQGGAWHVADPTGRPAILKWSHPSAPSKVYEVAEVIRRVRADGYPTPAWLAAGVTRDGVSYHVQEFVAGTASTPLTPPKVELLLGVLDRQAGLDPALTHDWSRRVETMALEDPPDGPRRVVQQLGARGQGLLDHFDRLLAGLGTVNLPTSDLVHGDFNSCNILLRDGAVSGVIDVEAVGRGTRAFDHASLLREAYVEGYGPEVAGLIRRAGEAVAGPGVLALCAAAASFDIVGFKLKHEPDRIDQILDRLHQLTDDLAEPL
ncbi:phosphotransferase [Actinopolymorpha pittospori]